MTLTDEQIEWWTVTPHPQTTRADYLVVREFSDVLKLLHIGIERFLDVADEGDLSKGVQLPFVVKRHVGTQQQFDAIELEEW